MDNFSATRTFDAVAAMRRTFTGLNTAVGRLCLRLFPESTSLIVLAFHAIVRDAMELQRKLLNPRYALTLDEFDQCVTYYLSHGYRAVSPLDIVRGLPPSQRFVMFTFDDGYANNLQVLPILERHRVPALFALATDYVLQQKAYWWDVVYQQGVELHDQSEVENEVDYLMLRNLSDIEKHLSQKYCGTMFVLDDASRPMRLDEVKGLANHPLVFWANHTARHEYLPKCTADEVRLTIGQAQEALESMTGSKPAVMVYPYGVHNALVRRVCRDFGLRIGFTMASFKISSAVDVNSDGAMALPRFAIYHDRENRGIARQCMETRIGWKPSWLWRGQPARRRGWDACQG